MINNHSATKIFALVFLAMTAVSTLGRTAEVLEIGKARIFYETAGQGAPVIFIHAGVADSRQWNNEFQSFSNDHSVIRYDMRGYGKSDPADGEYSHLGDLTRLLEHLNLHEPLILVGCSMGGRTALDYALEEPDKVRALILVDSTPSGFQTELPTPPKFKLVEEAEKAGKLELVSEIETQIWFDGDRLIDNVNQEMRQLVYDMNLIALRNDEKGLGTQLPNSETPAIERLAELQIPVLAIVGENDIQHVHAAVGVMQSKIPDCRHVTIKNAAHLPNMDQPEEFENILRNFIGSVAE